MYKYAFRPKWSTSSVITNLYTELLNHIVRGKCPVAILYDLGRAFDLVECYSKFKNAWILEVLILAGSLNSFLIGNNLFQQNGDSIRNIRPSLINVDIGVPEE